MVEEIEKQAVLELFAQMDQQHGGNKLSLKGLQIAVDYFLIKGHYDLKLFLPDFLSGCTISTSDRQILTELEKADLITYTRSEMEDQLATYDSKIVQYATDKKAVLLSNDDFEEFTRSLQENHR